MDLFSPIVEVVKLLCVPLVQQIVYLRDLEENMNVLRNKIDELSSRENDLTTELNRAKLQGWNPKDEVNNWLKNVNEAKNQVTGIQREFGENKKCLKGCLPNYCSRWKLSRRSLKLIAAVDELTKKSSFDAGVAVAPLPATAHLIPTTSLVVLDLSRTRIEMVPESLSNLVNLHALILVNCWKLKKIPDVGKLKELRVLNLRYSSIEELPEGMERLRKLRILDLSSTEKLERFPVGILPKLSLLEELSMLGSSCLWSSNEAEMMGRRIQIEEITGLTRLTSVNLDFSDTPSFSWYVRSLQHRVLRLKSFCLRVVNADIVALSRQNRIQIRGCDFFSRLNIFFLLLEDTCCLEFVECENCNGMECLIVAQDDKSNSSLLPRVNRLNIANMPDLKVLYRGPMVHGTFKTLSILEISGCPKLKNLFPRRLLRSLQSIESIEIGDCKIMEELVEEDDGCTNDERGKGNTVDDDHVIKLLGLKSMRLWSLPALKNICNKTLECNSLIHIHITECPHLSKLPLLINKPPSDFKGHIEGKRQWWDALEWVDPGTKALFHPFFIDEEESD
ncbi:hypothetical protein MRB53_014285 [Persea americana]|uniref:Uncharacterized protein n=1 Tax=Persea americana TaxID=3435 RepID=A0ACC2KAC3_PERAE|nr:hypothetical protein MRB53_014285 [Persea americana]